MLYQQVDMLPMAELLPTPPTLTTVLKTGQELG
jgi:hypothetical protein